MPIDGFAAYDYSSSVESVPKKRPLVVLPAIPLLIPQIIVKNPLPVSSMPAKNKILKSKKRRTRIVNIPETVFEESVSDSELQSRTFLDDKRFFNNVEKQRQYTLQKQRENAKRKSLEKSAPKVINASAVKPPIKIVIAPTFSEALLREYEEKLRADVVKSSLQLKAEENFLPRNDSLIIDDQIADNIKEQIDRVKSETNLIPVLPYIKENAGWIGAGVMMTMAGIVLAPVTWGVSLAISCVGMAIAIIGSIIAVVKSIQYFVSKHQYENDMQDYLNNHFIENQNYHRVGEIHGRVYFLKQSSDSLGFVIRADGLIESFRKTHDGFYHSTGVFSEMPKAVRMIKAEHISNEFKLNEKKNKADILLPVVHSSDVRSLTLFGHVGQLTDKSMQLETPEVSTQTSYRAL